MKIVKDEKNLIEELEKQKNIIILTDELIDRQVLNRKPNDVSELSKETDLYRQEGSQLKEINQMRLENIDEFLNTGKGFIKTKERINNKIFAI